jgi:hypothetical protein
LSLFRKGKSIYNVAIAGKFLILLFFAKPVIFKQRKRYILMGTYEIHTNFGVWNKSEDENNFMKDKFQIFPVIELYIHIPFVPS